MKDIKNILVPVDFSDSSRKALFAAAELAVAYAARIDLLHVWEVPPYIPPEAMVGVPGSDARSLGQLARDHAHEELARLTGELGGQLPLGETLLESGDPARTIVEVAARRGSDLIVIGTHGRTGLSHLLLGSVAERVVRRASCPVLTIRGTEPPR
jgi:nucleotide-binding universal stress UspA family protein